MPVDFGNHSLEAGCYTGARRNGKMHGAGRMEWPDGLVYEGEFQNDRYWGRGVFTAYDGWSYDGEFVDGKPKEQE